MGKAPAFQLYAADFYMDTVGWSCEEVGLYFRLLMAEWVNGPLPNDPVALARACQISTKKFIVNFNRLDTKFVKNEEGYLINKRLENTRLEQQNYSESRKNNAKKRWDDKNAHASTVHMHSACPSSSSSISTTEKKKNTPPPRKKLTDEEWLESLKSNPAYVGLDIQVIKGKCEAWCANKGKIFTRARFLNWLNREERPMTGGGNGSQQRDFRGKQAAYADARGNGGGGSGALPEYVPDVPPDISDEDRAAQAAKVREFIGRI
jgi:uncharacterized protein YdaU (DUF1376 family)